MSNASVVTSMKVVALKNRRNFMFLGQFLARKNPFLYKMSKNAVMRPGGVCADVVLG